MSKKIIACTLISAALLFCSCDAYLLKGYPDETEQTPTETERQGIRSYQKFNYYEDGGSIIIYSYTGNASELVVPAEIEGLPVKVIGKGAFKNKAFRKSVHLPASVEEIRESAFIGCTALETVQMGEGLIQIGASAFEGCGALCALSFPASLASIGAYAFKDCVSLSEAGLSAVAKIGDGAFEDSAALATADTLGRRHNWRQGVPWLYLAYYGHSFRFSAGSGRGLLLWLLISKGNGSARRAAHHHAGCV